MKAHCIFEDLECFTCRTTQPIEILLPNNKLIIKSELYSVDFGSQTVFLQFENLWVGDTCRRVKSKFIMPTKKESGI